MRTGYGGRVTAACAPLWKARHLVVAQEPIAADATGDDREIHVQHRAVGEAKDDAEVAEDRVVRESPGFANLV